MSEDVVIDPESAISFARAASSDETAHSEPAGVAEPDQAGAACRPRISLPGRASVGTPFSAMTSPATIVAT